MKYTEIAPSEEFSSLILNYWTFEVPETSADREPFIHEIMPEYTVSVVFINQPYYKGIRILGPQVKKYQQLIYPGSYFLGIRLNPWVKTDNIIANKKFIINKTIDSSNFLNNIFSEINMNSLTQGFTKFHLIERGLLKLVQGKEILLDPFTKYICLQLMGEAKINEFTKNIPLSIRPIQNHFKSTTGITMSRFRSIHRIQNTIKMVYLEKDSIADAAFKNNYTDHSHFINTFKKYMNTSVKNFLLQTEKIELSL